MLAGMRLRNHTTTPFLVLLAPFLRSYPHSSAPAQRTSRQRPLNISDINAAATTPTHTRLVARLLLLHAPSNFPTSFSPSRRAMFPHLILPAASLPGPHEPGCAWWAERTRLLRIFIHGQFLGRDQRRQFCETVGGLDLAVRKCVHVRWLI
ncbi:uncharacterized protein IWZ02DRAFT_220851 [Phyllosticta citriasiana]|uniref:uncharacterized protein n=1 Tax=Phyllosticta citriasiana TaxID=595635 RepID=UPI0030FD97C9